jgi:tryptophan synthase alpha chain
VIAARTKNALDKCLARARAEGRLALVMYLTAGFPEADSTRAWAPLLAESGASVLELGVPFSDPVGDGPTIQHSSQVALSSGMTMRGSLELARQIGAGIDTPIVLMSYCNPIFRMGTAAFARAAGEAGVTGVIVPDLPIEESDELSAELAAHGVHLIYLLSPASTDRRISLTAQRATGFIYCMALTGVTGARKELDPALPAFLARVRGLTEVPLVVGFGVSRPEHLQALRPHAGGAVVASALVDIIDHTPPEGRATAIAEYVKELSRACSGS